MGVLEIQDLKYSYDNKKNVLKWYQCSNGTRKRYMSFWEHLVVGKRHYFLYLVDWIVLSKGKILFNGKDIAEKGLENHRRNHVSFIFQAYTSD